jgi:hypothetical protein
MNRRVDTINNDLQEQDDRHGLDCSGSGQGHVAGYCKHGEPVGLIKCGFQVHLMNSDLPRLVAHLRKEDLSGASLDDLDGHDDGQGDRDRDQGLGGCLLHRLNPIASRLRPSGFAC